MAKEKEWPYLDIVINFDRVDSAGVLVKGAERSFTNVCGKTKTEVKNRVLDMFKRDEKTLQKINWIKTFKTGTKILA